MIAEISLNPAAPFVGALVLFIGATIYGWVVFSEIDRRNRRRGE